MAIFFRALKFQISEPQIWKKNRSFCGISGIFMRTSASENVFLSLENGRSVRLQSIPKNLLRLFLPSKSFLFSEVIFKDLRKTPFKTGILMTSRGPSYYLELVFPQICDFGCAFWRPRRGEQRAPENATRPKNADCRNRQFSVSWDNFS